MEILKHNEQSFEAILSPTDVFEACKQYVMKNKPEYVRGFIISPKYNLGSAILVGTQTENSKNIDTISTLDKI